VIGTDVKVELFSPGWMDHYFVKVKVELFSPGWMATIKLINYIQHMTDSHIYEIWTWNVTNYAEIYIFFKKKQRNYQCNILLVKNANLPTTTSKLSHENHSCLQTHDNDDNDIT
jgi:hypothetical protein